MQRLRSKESGVALSFESQTRALAGKGRRQQKVVRRAGTLDLVMPECNFSSAVSSSVLFSYLTSLSPVYRLFKLFVSNVYFVIG